MKKVLWILILLGGIVLTGCSQKNELSKDELFTKKQECFNMTEKIQNYLNKEWYTNRKLKNVFYSKEKNSCLYHLDWNTSNGNWEIIVDAFTHNEILTSRCWRNDPENNEFECIMDQKEFDKRIKELEW